MLRPTMIAFASALLVAQTPAPAPKQPTGHEGHAHAMPRPEAPKIEALKQEDKVLGRFGSRVYRESDFELFLSLALNPQQRMQVEMVQGAKENYRKQFLDFKVMELKARKDGMDQGAEYTRKRELMEAQVLVQDLVKRDSPELQKKVKLEEADVKAYYDKHSDQFKTPASFSARHLLVEVKAEKGKDEEAAKARLAKVQEELKAGKKLEELTKEFSDDPGSKEKGGLYENITYGSFVPEFEAAVRAQEPGKVGEPVKTQFGYHLIQVEKRNESVLPAFDGIKDQVRQKALAAKQEEVFQAYIQALQKEIGFTVGDAAPVIAPAPKAAKPVKKAGVKK